MMKEYPQPQLFFVALIQKYYGETTVSMWLKLSVTQWVSVSLYMYHMMRKHRQTDIYIVRKLKDLL